MKLTGNLNDIKQNRDSQHKDIAIEIDWIEYITYKKDGKYHQPFDFLDELDVPLIITGDLLARNSSSHLEEGEYEFQVYDKVNEDYVLNPDKKLEVTTAYDFDVDLTILTSVSYTVVVSNDEFRQIKTDSSNAKKKQKSRGRKK